MSKTMVTVEFDEYLELREFKKAIENNNTISIYEKFDGYFFNKSLKIITKDEAVLKLANELKESKEMCSKLNDTIESLEYDKNVYRKESEDMECKISEIREFSIWQFLKFKKYILK
jgi:hypothetical protein